MTIDEIEKNYTRLDGKDPPAVKLFRDLIDVAKAAKDLIESPSHDFIIDGDTGAGYLPKERTLKEALSALESTNEKGIEMSLCDATQKYISNIMQDYGIFEGDIHLTLPPLLYLKFEFELSSKYMFPTGEKSEYIQMMMPNGGKFIIEQSDLCS